MTEGQIHDNVRIPPLTQTLDELSAELQESIALKAVLGSRIVGAARARRVGTTLHIGRLAVAPDLQGMGIGTRLWRRSRPSTPTGSNVHAVHGPPQRREHPAVRAARYRLTREELLEPDIHLVHLEKPAR